jgi:transposase
MAFFKRWVARQPAGKLIAYDITSFSTYAKDIVDREWGCNRNWDKLPQINLGCFLSEGSGLPAFYVVYPGSILDKSHLPAMTAYNSELGIKDVVFILGKGFCSTANVKFMAEEGHAFILGVPKSSKTALAAIDLAREGIISLRNSVGTGVYAVSMKGCFYGTEDVMNVCFSEDLAIRQRKDLFRSIESQEETLVQLTKMSERDINRYRTCFSIYLKDDGSPAFERNYRKIDELTKYCGFFCLLTNTDLPAQEVLSKFCAKDMIEKSFCDIKNHMDIIGHRTDPAQTTAGKLFCSYISLIVATEIGSKLGVLMEKKGWNKDCLIRQLEKIRVVVFENGKRLVTPLTESQLDILEAFGLGEDDVKKYISRNN